jgi:hypothetical protein
VLQANSVPLIEYVRYSCISSAAKADQGRCSAARIGLSSAAVGLFETHLLSGASFAQILTSPRTTRPSSGLEIFGSSAALSPREYDRARGPLVLSAEPTVTPAVLSLMHGDDFSAGDRAIVVLVGCSQHV